MKMLRLFSIAAIASLMAIGCEKRENYDDNFDSSLNIVTSLSAGETSASIDHIAATMTLLLPAKSETTDVELTIEVPNGVTVTPASGSVVDLSAPIEVVSRYNHDVRRYTLSTRVLPSGIAFLADAPSYDALVDPANSSNYDDDVIAAAKWAKQTYGEDFVYLDANTLTYEQLESINVVFFYYDQVGSTTLPALYSEGNVKSVLLKYTIGGGKMMLGGFGNCMMQILGRDQSGMMTIVGAGAGGENPDNWSVEFTTSELSTTLTDGATKEANGFVNVIDRGFKEDHNVMWSPVGGYAAFTATYGGTPLASWGGTVKFEDTAGIIFWDKHDSFQGSFMTIGIAGMEWSMNDGRTNQYMGNVHTIYKNAIDYLSTK